jgi:hypothetical protein
MARMLPPLTAAQFASAAERVLFQELERQLSDEYRVLHGVRWVSRTGGRQRDGEADFVIAHPRHGVLVLEVKGGVIACDGATGQWTSTDGKGETHEIDDPFAQALRNMYALIDRLAEHPETAGARYRVARAVAFPDMLVDPKLLPPDAPRNQIIDSGDLPTIVRALGRAWDGTPGEAPGEPAIAALVRLLRPSVTIGRLGLVGAMRAEALELTDLTDQQIQIMEVLTGQRRLLVQGVAGSGKTMLALEATRRLGEQGFRTLYTCFNKGLAAAARDQLSDTLSPDAHALVRADHYHELAMQLVQEAKGSFPLIPDAGMSAFFREDLPIHLLEALESLPDRFDAIVVDEGQDFEEGWWETLFALLADPTEGIFYLFYDDNQRIFEQGVQGKFPVPGPPMPLTRNCRTTRAIHEAAAAYAPEGSRGSCGGPEGRPPVCVPCELGEPGVTDALRRVVHDLVTGEGVPPGEIVVLTPRAARTSFLPEGLALGTCRLTWEEGGDRAIRCRSIQSFKGLEADIVILAEADRVRPSSADGLMHVALTRARHHVVVLGELPAPRARDRAS